MRNVKGKLALVTGSARGIGLRVATRLAREGARIVMTDVRGDDVRAAAEGVRGDAGPASAYALDVTDGAAILEVRDRIHADLGRVEILVNNAGVVHGGAFLDVPMDEHLRTFRVNTLGLVAVTHAFLPDLVARAEGHLVNVASASGLIGLPFGATYAASKWAVIGFSESIRLELRALRYPHVKVTTVCPSYVGTGMFDGVKAPRLTPVLDPDVLAEAIWDAIQRDRPFVLAPPVVKLLPFLKGAVPGRVFDVVAEALGVSTSMAAWRGHAGGDREGATTGDAGSRR